MSELNVFELPIFADANIWSMWPADKLNELAEDIKENGFDHRYPITIAEVNGEWMLLDGRNRREAAKIAGIIPPVIVTDVDPKLAVHRSNNQNRDATPGQKAMATAMAFPESTKGGDRKSKDFKSFDPEEFGFSGKTIQRARYVLRNNPIAEGQHYPQRCLDIMAGSLSLTDAYAKTQEDVQKREEEARVHAENAAKLNDVRARYPNLAALVDDERLSLAQAIASAEQSDREAYEKSERDAREAAELERVKQEEFARQSKFEEQVAKVRESAPDLADKMQAGRLDFDSAMRVINERVATKKAQDDAALDSFYKFSEIVAIYSNESNAALLKKLLIDNSEYYRDRWRRPVRDSINNVMTFLDNKEVFVRAFNEVLNR